MWINESVKCAEALEQKRMGGRPAERLASVAYPSRQAGARHSRRTPEFGFAVRHFEEHLSAGRMGEAMKLSTMSRCWNKGRETGQRMFPTCRAVSPPHGHARRPSA